MVILTAPRVSNPRAASSEGQVIVAQINQKHASALLMQADKTLNFQW